MEARRSSRPLRGRHEMLDEALDLVGAARAAGVDVRLVGGLAVLALCTDERHCRRDHRDLDLVAPRSSAKKLLATFARLAWVENVHVRMATAGSALQLYRPCVHRDGRGRPAHDDDRVDVYLDAFRLHHTLALRQRLGREAFTVPPSDVLLAKLLRTHLSMVDVADVATLLLDVELAEEERPGVIGLRYVGRACARDWGLYHDVTGNLERVAAEADALGLDGVRVEGLHAAVTRVLTALRTARKGPRWRLRAAVGERLPWYDAVDDDDGRRVWMRERPAA